MKATEMLSQIKAMLGAKLNLAQATLEDGTTVIEAENMEAGQPVFIVSDDERIALPVGEYTTSEGQIIVVAEEGVIAEIKDALEDEAKEEEPKEEPKEEQLEEEVAVEVPEGAVEEVSTIIESVVEVIAPIIEEVKEQVEELKRKMSEMEDKKEKMSSQKPARKPMKHNPNVKKSEPTNLYGQNYNFNTTKDRVFNKIFNK